MSSATVVQVHRVSIHTYTKAAEVYADGSDVVVEIRGGALRLTPDEADALVSAIAYAQSDARGAIERRAAS